MSMFTTLTLNDGTEIQFKTYRDDMDNYKLGDLVAGKGYAHIAGCGRLLDGVYDGLSGQYPDILDWWVVIKDHHLVAAVRCRCGDGSPTYQQIHDQYQVIEPPDNLWPPEAWEELRQREKRHKAEFEEELKNYANFPSEEAAARAAINLFTKARMKEPSILDLILPPAEVM